MVVSLQHHYPQTAPAGSGMCSAAPRLTRTQLITPLSQHISSSNCACWKTSLALHFALQKKQTCWLQKYVTPSHRKGKSIEDYLFVIWLINSSNKMFVWLIKIRRPNEQLVNQFVDWSTNRRANNPLLLNARSSIYPISNIY